MRPTALIINVADDAVLLDMLARCRPTAVLQMPEPEMEPFWPVGCERVARHRVTPEVDHQVLRRMYRRTGWCHDIDCRMIRVAGCLVGDVLVAERLLPVDDDAQIVVARAHRLLAALRAR